MKLRNDELGLLSNSLDDMTLELQKRISHAENFSTDLVHEIRNPLASLKSASEILHDTNDKEQRLKLINILSHDVQRIERLITDYSQMLKDEVALSKEKIKKLDIEPIIKSVVDDFNNIYKLKRGIKISYENDGKNKYFVNGIENRIEQIIGRGVRNLSHCLLPFEERNVEIYLYSMRPIQKSDNSKVETVDMYVYRLAEKKSQQIDLKLHLPLFKYFSRSKKKYDLIHKLFLYKPINKLSTFLNLDAIKALINIKLFQLLL